ncbi:MAG: 2Fe-2S iron-sulfur cluster binding domain-containing protein [Bdellovibrionales bacterium]|nr:2Fe-2S iron-sulfur cluster binding domain-containing protein [Bdellovibrionales bacterium]
MSDDTVTLTIEGEGSYSIPKGKRMILALREEAATDQLHACGGKGKCTTCKLEFIEGEPAQMTEVERDILKERGLTGVRLSCQLACNQDMAVRLVSRMEGSGRSDCGSTPAAEIFPDPVWIDKE